MGGPSEFSATCTRQTTTDTKGSGIHYVVDTADGRNLEEVWFTGHPEFGLWVDQGTDGFWATDLSFHGNGFWPGESESSAANVSGTATVITDSGKSWTTDEWKGYFVNIVDGASGETRDRVVQSNTATTFTVLDLTSVDAFTVTATNSTYKIDRGGGLIIENSTVIGVSTPEELVGCRVENINADGNEPAVVVMTGGLITNGGGCTFVGLDVEGDADAPYAAWLHNQQNNVRFDGIDMRGTGTLAAIYMTGSSYPLGLTYNGVTIKESAVTTYISTAGLDDPAYRFSSSGRTHDGRFFFGANFGGWNNGPQWSGPLADPPYTCTNHYQGHSYWDTTSGPCMCDGSVDLWCPLGVPGCLTSTDCDSGT